MNQLEESFQRARENPKYRQEFVDGLKLDNLPIKKIRYVPKLGLFSRRRSLMTTSSGINRELEVKGGKSTITIYSSAFDHASNLDDFMSILEDHEGMHAEDNLHFYEHRTEKRELLAYYNQLRRFDERECSPIVMRVMEERFEELGGFETLRELNHPFPELNKITN